jgi:hypothetical protein
MAALQGYFESFHNKIRLDYECNRKLAEKRDIVLGKIAKHLSDNNRPAFTRLLQGSYKMRTGVFPTAGKEFDIDVGLQFDFDGATPDAQEVRAWVFDAIASHTDKVKEKAPCIRVHYKDDDPYHLDLVTYSREPTGMRLAKASGWVPADPVGLLSSVTDAQARFADTEGSTGIDQLRRAVRYLKRWGDIRSVDEEERPTGLAYTLLAIANLRVGRRWDNSLDDASALRQLAEYAGGLHRIQARKPTPEYEDMFGRLSEAAMGRLKDDLRQLAATISAAEKELDPHEACAALQKVFGEDFPLPPKGSTGRTTGAPAIVTSSSSA